MTVSATERAFRVTVMCNRWDKDEGRLNVEVRATDPVAARKLAADQVRARYPDALGLGAEELDA